MKKLFILLSAFALLAQANGQNAVYGPATVGIVRSISPDGKYLTGRTAAAQYQAYTWDIEAGNTIISLGAIKSEGYDVTNSNQVVGYFNDPALLFEEAPIQSGGINENGTWTGLGLGVLDGTSPVSLTSGSQAGKITADGKTIVGFCNTYPEGSVHVTPYSWTYNDDTQEWEGTEWSDPDNSAQGASVIAVSGDGTVGAGWVNLEGGAARTGILWRTKDVHEIFDYGDPAAYSEYLCLSRNGKYAGFRYAGQAGVYNVETDEYTIIPNATLVNAISDNGFAVGAYNNNTKGFVWSEQLGFMDFGDFVAAYAPDVTFNINFVQAFDKNTTFAYSLNAISADGQVFPIFHSRRPINHACVLKLASPVVVVPFPKNLTATVERASRNTVVLNWEAPAEWEEETLQSYTIYRNNDSINTVAAGVVTCTDSDAPAGYHNYSVRAVYNESTSRHSDAAVATVVDSYAMPFTEGFETFDFTANYWTPVNEAGKSSWSAGAGYGVNGVEGGASLDVTHSQTETFSAQLISKPLDATGAQSVFVNYMVYAHYYKDNDLTCDTIYLDVSTDGSTWTNASKYVFQELIDWKYETVDISSLAAGELVNVRLRIEGINTSINTKRYFFDNISVSETVTGGSAIPLSVIGRASGEQLELAWQNPEALYGLTWQQTPVKVAFGNAGVNFIAAQSFDADQLALYEGLYLTSISAFIDKKVANPTTPTALKLAVFVDGTRTVTQDITTFTEKAWNTFALETPLLLSSVTGNLKIGIEVTAHESTEQPIGADEMGRVVAGKGDLYSEDGGVTWLNLSDQAGDMYKCNWTIIGNIAATDNTAERSTDILGYNIYRDNAKLNDYLIYGQRFATENSDGCYTVKAFSLTDGLSGASEPYCYSPAPAPALHHLANSLYMMDVSENGNYVTGYHPNGGGAVLWTKGETGFTYLDEGDGSISYAVSNTGVVGGQFRDPNVTFNGNTLLAAGYYTEGEWHALGLRPGYTPVDEICTSNVEGISADGTKIGGSWYMPGFILEPVTWTNDVATALQFEQVGQGARVQGMSADGTVLCGWAGPNNARQPVVWVNGEMRQIKYNGIWGEGEAHEVSANGKYVALAYGVPSQAALYDVENDELTLLGMLPGTTNSTATDVTNSGMVIGYSAATGMPPVRAGFIYSSRLGMKRLSTYLTELGLTEAATFSFDTPMGVSGDGLVITGFGFMNGGWVVELVEHLTAPAPPTGLTVVENGFRSLQLNWVAAEETSGMTLNGYNIYRNSIKVNEAPIAGTTFIDSDLPNGNYSYRATAVWDEMESIPSGTVTINAAEMTLPFADDFSSESLNTNFWNTSGLQWKVTPSNGIKPPCMYYAVPIGNDYSEYVISPYIDATGAGDLFLSFNLGRAYAENDNTKDSLTVEVFDGTEWHFLQKYAPELEIASFEYQQFDISDMAAGEQMRIRFTAAGKNSGEVFLAWNIDNVRIFTSDDALIMSEPLNLTAHKAADGTVRLNWADPGEVATLSYFEYPDIIDNIGNEGTTFIAGAMFEPDDLAGYDDYQLVSVSAYLFKPGFFAPQLKLVVFQGQNKVVDQAISSYVNEWNTFELETPLTVTADMTEPLYFGIEVVTHNATQYPIGLCPGETVTGAIPYGGRGNLFSEDGGQTWGVLTEFELNGNVAVKANLKRSGEAQPKERLMGYRLLRNDENLLGQNSQGSTLLTTMNNFTDMEPLTGVEACYKVAAYYDTQQSSEPAEACLSPVEYTINLSANPTAGGEVEGGGNYMEGAQATVKAIPAANYNFVNWTEDDIEVENANAEYTFTVTGNRTLVANFELKTYTIAVSATEGGSVSGGNTYAHGEQATVTATPDEHYTFVNWTENGSEVTDAAAEYTFTVTGNRTLVANFELKTYTIAVSATEGGSVSGGGAYAHNEQATVTATPDANYTFVNWTEDGVEVENAAAEYTFTVTSDRTLVANFALQQFEVTYNAPENGTLTVTAGSETVANGSMVNYNTELVITATPAEGYKLQTLTVNGAAFNSGDTHTVTADVEIECTFTDDVGIDETGIANITVYGNEGNVYIVNKNSVNLKLVQILDVLGRVVYSGKASSSVTIPVNGAGGIYVVKLISDDNKVLSAKVILND